MNKYLEPVFTDNYTAIAMSSSDEYLPYLTVCLQSLVDNTNSSNNYDIIIFTSSKNNNVKDIIKKHLSKKNISIRFYNPQNLFRNIKLRVTASNFHEACFYRVVAPLVLNKYKKVIFTDIDLIFNCDIKKLYSIDIGNYPLAACKEPLWEYLINIDANFKRINIAKYSKETLQLKDINTYYNTGVIIFNIEEFNKNNYVEQLLDLINKNYFIYQEQCALNCLLKDNIYTLDPVWNGELEKNVVNDLSSLENVNIIHFLAKDKPWNGFINPFNFIWWEYARKTPFYEHILYNTISKVTQERAKILKEIKKKSLVCWKCNIFKKITFGKSREHYIKKEKKLKKEINELKLFL